MAHVRVALLTFVLQCVAMHSGVASGRVDWLNIAPPSAFDVGGWRRSSAAEQWFSVRSALEETQAVLRERLGQLGWTICSAGGAGLHDEIRGRVSGTDRRRPGTADTSLYISRPHWAGTVALYRTGRSSTYADVRVARTRYDYCGVSR